LGAVKIPGDSNAAVYDLLRVRRFPSERKPQNLGPLDFAHPPKSALPSWAMVAVAAFAVAGFIAMAFTV
jgi:hypothetical protein